MRRSILSVRFTRTSDVSLTNRTSMYDILVHNCPFSRSLFSMTPLFFQESHNCWFFCLNRLNGFSNGHFPSVNMRMRMRFSLFFGACTKTTTHQHTYQLPQIGNTPLLTTKNTPINTISTLPPITWQCLISNRISWFLPSQLLVSTVLSPLFLVRSAYCTDSQSLALRASCYSSVGYRAASFRYCRTFVDTHPYWPVSIGPVRQTGGTISISLLDFVLEYVVLGISATCGTTEIEDDTSLVHFAYIAFVRVYPASDNICCRDKLRWVISRREICHILSPRWNRQPVKRRIITRMRLLNR